MQLGKWHDWENEVYALYKGDAFITEGNVYEIAKETGKNVETIKFYTYPSHVKKCERWNKWNKQNFLRMCYLFNEGEEDLDDE